MPAALSIGFAVPDLRLPRVEPCTAIVDARGSTCGATPTSQYHRTCGTASHGEDIWLCPVHAALVAAGAAMCRECARRGGVVRARVYRIVQIPVRLPI